MSLEVHARNYEVIYKHTDYAGVWDHVNGWEDDGATYLIYDDIGKFKTELKNKKLDTFYSYDSVTKKTHYINIPADAPVSEKLAYFNIQKFGDKYHVYGKLPDNFTDYVDNMIVASGKDKIIIPLRNEEEYGWAKEYKARGFFKNHKIVRTEKDAKQYGVLKPIKAGK